MQVKDIMSADVSSCGVHTNLEQVAAMMWQKDCGAIPIVDDQEMPVGIVTDRDIAIGSMLQHRSLWQMNAGETHNAQPLESCKIDDDIHTAIEIMQAHRIRRLPVVDEQGKLVGMLSMNDVINHAEQKRAAELSYADTVTGLKGISEHDLH